MYSLDLPDYCAPIINQLKNIYWFLKRSAPGDTSPSLAKKPKSDTKQGDISAAFRTLEFKAYFYDSGRKMFCKSCNVVMDHIRKFVVKQHLDSKKHNEKAANAQQPSCLGLGASSVEYGDHAICHQPSWHPTDAKSERKDLAVNHGETL